MLILQESVAKVITSHKAMQRSHAPTESTAHSLWSDSRNHLYCLYISLYGYEADKAITSEQTEQAYNDVVLKFLGGQGQDGSTGKPI